jgi:putative flippase GtrA
VQQANPIPMTFKTWKSLVLPFFRNQVFSFAFVGASSSLVYMLILTVLSVGFGWSSTPSIIVAYIVGTVVSYVGSGMLAFRKKMTGSNLVKFLVVVGLSFVANIVISEVLSPLGVHTVVIGAINVCFVGVFNFLCHKYWTFRHS